MYIECMSRWDTSQVTQMNQLFWEADAFNPDLSGWDVSSVTSCSMFNTADLMPLSSFPAGCTES